MSWFKDIIDQRLNNGRGSGGFSSWVNRLLGGQSGYGQKYFGNSPAYNDASDQLDAGRFVGAQEILSRFHYGNEWGTASSNELFSPGHEDPTHLTFKIEFGEWGSSVTSMDTIRAYQYIQMTTNTDFMDYDQMPMGLLDLNFAFNPNSPEFSTQKTYNAYNFLLHRNEDRRAQFIKDFVEGLYVLQKDFPYMFQKISGLQKLMDVDVTHGQRIKKDTTLQLTCISDSVDQKLFHLLHLYRSAAWNDLYQRWELPDIYRYFKMIIYIYDNRCLHMGNGLFSIDQDYFPILALECGPCEFVVNNHLENEYTVNAFDIKDNTPTIDIKVHNVKVLWKNGMMERVKFAWDLQTKSDHEFKNDTDSWNTEREGGDFNWKFEWMKRFFMMPDEYNAFSTIFQPDPVTHYFADREDDRDKGDTQMLYYADMDLPYDNTWHRATVTDEAYVIRSFSDLWGAFKSIITQNTTLIRDSRTPDRYYFRNDLMHLDYSTFEYYVKNNMVKIDVDRMQTQMVMRALDLLQQLDNYRIQMNLDTKSEVKGPGIIQNLTKPQEELSPIDLNLDTMQQLLDFELLGESIPDQELTPLDLNLEKAEQELAAINLNLDKLLQELTKLDLNLDKPSQTLVEIIKNLLKPDMTLTPIDLNLDHIIQTLTALILNLSKPDMSLTELLLNLEKIEQELAMLYMNLEKPDQNLQELLLNLEHAPMELQPIIMNLDHILQTLQELILNTDKPDMDFTPLAFNLSKTLQALTWLILNLEKGIQEYTPLEMNLRKPEQEYAELILNLEKMKQNLTDLIIDTHKLPQEMSDLILNLSKQKQQLQKIIENLKKPDMEMSELELNEEHPDMSMTEQSMDEHHADMSMTEQPLNTDKPVMNMTESLNDEHHSDMTMTDTILYTDKPEQELTDVVIDNHHADMSMTDVVSNDDKPDMELVPVDMNTEKPDMNMPEQILNESHEDMTMTPQIQSENTAKPDMIPLDTHSSLPDMQMEPVMKPTYEPQLVTNVELYDSSVPDMNMREMLPANPHPDMNMIDPVMNTDKPQQELTEQVLNLQKPDTEMTPQHINVYQQGMEMTPLHEEIKQNKFDMQSIIVNNNKVTEVKNVTLTDSVKPEEMKMSHIQDTEYKPEMDMSAIDSVEYNPELKDVRLNDSAKPEDMKMKPIDEQKYEVDMEMKPLNNPLKPEDMKMKPIDEQDYEVNMDMKPLEESGKVDKMDMKPLEDSEYEQDMKMKSIEDSSSMEKMDMKPIEESKPVEEMQMKPISSVTEPSEKPVMNRIEETPRPNRNSTMPEMVKIDVPKETKMFGINDDGSVGPDEEAQKARLKTGQIVQNTADISDKLKKQIETLVSIDTDTLKDASIENLVKLINMYQDTISEVKSTMKMNKIHTAISSTKRIMNMPVINQGERNVFSPSRTQMIDVPEEAIDRASNAQARAREKGRHKKN